MEILTPAPWGKTKYDLILFFKLKILIFIIFHCCYKNVNILVLCLMTYNGPRIKGQVVGIAVTLTHRKLTQTEWLYSFHSLTFSALCVAGRGSALPILVCRRITNYNKKHGLFSMPFVLFLGSRGSRNQFMGQLLQGQSSNTVTYKKTFLSFTCAFFTCSASQFADLASNPKLQSGSLKYFV